MGLVMVVWDSTLNPKLKAASRMKEWLNEELVLFGMIRRPGSYCAFGNLGFQGLRGLGFKGFRISGCKGVRI